MNCPGAGDGYVTRPSALLIWKGLKRDVRGSSDGWETIVCGDENRDSMGDGGGATKGGGAAERSGIEGGGGATEEGSAGEGCEAATVGGAAEGGSTEEGVGAVEGCRTCSLALGRGMMLTACPLPPFLRDVEGFCDFFANCWRVVTGNVAHCS